MWRNGKLFACVATVALLFLLLTTSTSVFGSTSPNAVWGITTVESLGDVGKGISVAVSPVNGATYISYYDDDDNSLHAAVYVGHGGNCVDGTWQCVFVDGQGFLSDAVGYYNDIAVDPTTGYPMIVYYDSTHRRLKYATTACDDMSCPWSKHILEDTDTGNPTRFIGHSPSLQIGSDGIAQVAYHEDFTFGAGRLMYAKNVGGGTGNCDHPDWECTMIEDGTGVGKTPSLDITRNLTPLNNPYIASYDEGNGDLRYAWYLGNGSGNCGGNDWRCLIIDKVGDVGVNPSLSISDGADFSAITYMDNDNGKIKIARSINTVFPGNCGYGIAVNHWQCDNIYSAASAGGWTDISMARMGASDPVAVFGCPACIGDGIIQVKWVGYGGSCSTTSWDCNLIAGSPLSSQDYSQYVDLALSGEGMSTVAFYDATAGDALVMMERDRIYLPISLLE